MSQIEQNISYLICLGEYDSDRLFVEHAPSRNYFVLYPRAGLAWILSVENTDVLFIEVMSQVVLIFI